MCINRSRNDNRYRAGIFLQSQKCRHVYVYYKYIIYRDPDRSEREKLTPHVIPIYRSRVYPFCWFFHRAKSSKEVNAGKLHFTQIAVRADRRAD